MWHATQRASCSAATMTAGAIAHPASHNATVPSLILRSWKRTWRRATRPGAAWTMSSWSQVKSSFWQSDYSWFWYASVSEYTNIAYLSISMRVYLTHQELQGYVCNVHFLHYKCEIKDSLCWIIVFQLHNDLVYICCSLLFWVLFA